MQSFLCLTSPAHTAPATSKHSTSRSTLRCFSRPGGATKMALKVVKWNEQQNGKLTSDSMLKRLESLGFSGHIYRFGPGMKFGWHTHASDKKDAIITGKFMLKSRDQEVVLGPGDMLDIPKGMEHYAETIGQEVVTFVDSTRF